jgi:hypothetical protein
MTEPDLGTELRKINEPAAAPRPRTRRALIFRPQDALDAAGRRYPWLVAGLSTLIGGAGVGYVWAALFGDGLHGTKTGAALDNSNSYPDANAALLGAAALVVVSLFVWTSAAVPKGRKGLLIWAASLTGAGLCLFGVSRLFI